MNITFFGAGTWGFCLAQLLAENGHQVFLWSRNESLVSTLQSGQSHPKLKGCVLHGNMKVDSDLQKALAQPADCYVESVTLSGIRSIFNALKESGAVPKPLVLTSKGIEQTSGFLPSEVAIDALGMEWQPFLCTLSGPSHAEEVVHKLPTSVVCSSYEEATRNLIQDLFSTKYFRIYPNSDMHGVEFGGAMKNIIAIACGISDGLGFGDNTKALLMTRGLHEIRKLATVKGCEEATLNGLSGMGDLCVTCLSTHSRNYNFGRALAEGLSADEARKKIGMAVEGIYSCVSAHQLGKENHIPLPITDSVYRILNEGLPPQQAVQILMQREAKEEHL